MVDGDYVRQFRNDIVRERLISTSPVLLDKLYQRYPLFSIPSNKEKPEHPNPEIQQDEIGGIFTEIKAVVSPLVSVLVPDCNINFW